MRSSIDDDFHYITPLWQLADPLTVEQAAALIAGYDPNIVRFNADGGVYFENENGLTDSNGGHWVQTALAALKNAVNSGKLRARLVFSAQPRYEAGIDYMMERGYWNNEDISVIEDNATKSEYVIRNVPDWDKSLVGRDDLKAWLVGNGYRTGFFFPESTEAVDYLDPKHARYAPKLAAAVNAWIAVTDPGKVSPRQALEKWLREHAAMFGMTDDLGNPVKQAIEECSKVANWQGAGGAPKTL
jgi:hypothetical protein